MRIREATDGDKPRVNTGSKHCKPGVNGQPSSTITTATTTTEGKCPFKRAEERRMHRKNNKVYTRHFSEKEGYVRVARLHGFTPWEKGERLEVRS